MACSPRRRSDGLATGLFLSAWPSMHFKSGLLIYSASGALIGLGLFFVFRSDPEFRPKDEIQS